MDFLRTVDGMDKFGNDDGYVIGPPAVVFPVLERFASKVRDKHFLHLQPSKCAIFSWSGVMPIEAPSSMQLGGVKDGDFFILELWFMASL